MPGHCPGLPRTIKSRFMAILTMYLKRSLWVYSARKLCVWNQSESFILAEFAKTVTCDVGQPIRQPISMCKPKRGSFTGIISPSHAQGLILADIFSSKQKRGHKWEKCLWLCCFELRKERIRGQWLKWFSTCSNLQIYMETLPRSNPVFQFSEQST